MGAIQIFVEKQKFRYFGAMSAMDHTDFIYLFYILSG